MARIGDATADKWDSGIEYMYPEEEEGYVRTTARALFASKAAGLVSAAVVLGGCDIGGDCKCVELSF